RRCTVGVLAETVAQPMLASSEAIVEAEVVSEPVVIEEYDPESAILFERAAATIQAVSVTGAATGAGHGTDREGTRSSRDGMSARARWWQICRAASSNACAGSDCSRSRCQTRPSRRGGKRSPTSTQVVLPSRRLT